MSEIRISNNGMDVNAVKDFYLTHSIGFYMPNSPSLENNTYFDNFDIVQQSWAENARRAAISAIVKFLPQIGSYEEENKKIIFDIVFGVFGTNINKISEHNVSNKTIETVINARFDCIHRLEITSELNNKEKIDEFSNKIKSIIKKTIPICNNNHNLFIMINIENENDNYKYYIDCGIYTALPDSSSTIERQFINNRFIVAHCTRKGIIYISGIDLKNNENNLDICINNFTFNRTQCNTKLANIYEYDDETARVWHGIFEKVKRHVHGTICLIVDYEWKLEKDDTFDGTSKMDLSIPLIYDSQNRETFDNNVDIFLSMLDYDGITVINSVGHIKAYNLFCKNEDSNTTILGGARRRAYETVKRKHNGHYLGLYFQSQEGEIRFYNFAKGVCFSYFDPNIMVKPNLNSADYLKAQSYKASLELLYQQQNNNPNVNKLYILIDNMKQKHYGISNFSLEPSAAKELEEWVVTHPNETRQYDYILCELISIVIICLIGNAYGYSYDAEMYYLLLIQFFTKDDWTKFFDYRYYYLNNLVNGLIDTRRLKRLLELIRDEKLTKNIPEKYINKIKKLDIYDLFSKINNIALSVMANTMTDDHSDEYDEDIYDDNINI